MDYEIIELQVQDYFSPECTCRIEEMVIEMPHVVEASFDQLSNMLKVKVHRGMSSDSDIIKELKQCTVLCEQRKPAHEK